MTICHVVCEERTVHNK